MCVCMCVCIYVCVHVCSAHAYVCVSLQEFFYSSPLTVFRFCNSVHTCSILSIMCYTLMETVQLIVMAMKQVVFTSTKYS